MNPLDNSELIDASLAADADFKTSLRRVSYQPGMLLGLEATKTEQAYHRRHLNRHNYWLHGSGTVVGLRVTAKSSPIEKEDQPSSIQLHISPGIGVDGLGREITVNEPYCIDLGAWLTSKFLTNTGKNEKDNLWNALIRDGYDKDTQQLWLKVTMRYREIPSGLQPVQAFDTNAGTDAVQPSRLQDCVLFELLAEHPNAVTQGDTVFSAHNALPEWNTALENQLNPVEQDRIQQASGNKKKQLQLAARLLHALTDDNDALNPRENLTLTTAELARTLIARVSIQLTASQELILDHQSVTVDNLSRPFLFNATTLAQLIHD